jgi:hypothetical protein
MTSEPHIEVAEQLSMDDIAAGEVVEDAEQMLLEDTVADPEDE